MIIYTFEHKNCQYLWFCITDNIEIISWDISNYNMSHKRIWEREDLKCNLVSSDTWAAQNKSIVKNTKV